MSLRRSLLHACLLLLAAPALAAASHDDRVATNAEGGVVVDALFFDVYEPPAARLVARLDAGLTPVVTFGRNGFQRAADQVSEGGDRPVELTDDGVVIQVRSASGSPRRTILRRLLPDGRPDTAFGPDGARELDLAGADFDVDDVRLDDEDRLVLAGAIGAGGDDERGALARLLPDASLDPAFGGDGLVEMPVGRGALRGIEPVGSRVQARGRDFVVRVEADGALDESFGAGGFQALDPGSFQAVSASGAGLLLARGLGEQGIEVERRLENGSPDPDWGTAGRAVLPLDAGDGVSYSVSAVLARPGGGAAVGSARYDDAHPEVIDDDTLTGPLVLLDAGGDLETVSEQPLGTGTDFLERRADGAVVAFGSYVSDLCACVPGDSSVVALAVYDDTGARIASRGVKPRFLRPDVTIDAGPPTAPGSVTGSSATFAFGVKPGFDGDEVALDCALGDGAFAPCPADGKFSDLPEGPAKLRVVARGINDARSDERVYEWTVNHRAPATTVTSAPPASTDATDARIEFNADEPATFECTVDGGAPAACDSGVLALSGLAVGAHQVAIQARDRFGALEAAPVLVRWTVAARAGQPAPPIVQPPVVTPPLVIDPPTTRKIEIVKVGKLRRGKVRVRVLPPSTGKLRIRLSARIGGRTRRLGARVVQGRSGVARTWAVKLTRRGQRLVDRAARRSKRVKIRALATPVGDAARR